MNLKDSYSQEEIFDYINVVNSYPINKKADELNTAFEEIKKMEGVIHKAFYEVMTNYQLLRLILNWLLASRLMR